MGKSLHYLMQEVDSIIEKKAAEEPSVSSSYDTNIDKIASELVSYDPEPDTDVSDEMAWNEKLAYSLAIAEAFINLPYIQKLASFEKKAFDSGYTPEQIEEHLVKTGADDRYIPLSRVMEVQNKGKKRGRR